MINTYPKTHSEMYICTLQQKKFIVNSLNFFLEGEWLGVFFQFFMGRETWIGGIKFYVKGREKYLVQRFKILFCFLHDLFLQK